MMKRCGGAAKLRSPDAHASRTNKLSDHTSPPRKFSRNDPEADRRRSECLNFLSRSRSGKKKGESPVHSTGLLSKEHRKADDSTQQRMKCSTKAGEKQMVNCSPISRQPKPVNVQKPPKSKYDEKIKRLERKLEQLKLLRMTASAEELAEQKSKAAKKVGQKSQKKIVAPQRMRELPSKKVQRPSKKSNKDFVLVGHEILAIQNSEQLEELLRKRKDEEQQQSSFSSKSTNRPSEVLERYVHGALQAFSYQNRREVIQALSHENRQNELDTVMFDVKDLSSDEKADLFKKLKLELQQQPQKVSSEENASQSRFERVLRIAIDIVQRKFHLAKLLLQKLQVDPTGKIHGRVDKIAKLTQWKNKKFRQLMTAKTFMELNRRSPPTLDEEADPLRTLGVILQREFEQLVNEKHFHPLNRRKPQELVQLHSVQQQLREEERQSRETFLLDNTQLVPQKFIDEIKRARQIKEAVKATLQDRISLQQSQIEEIREEGVLGLSTNLVSINFYLARLVDFILERYEQQFLINIRKCYGLNVQSKLRMLRNLSRTGVLTYEPTFSEILSNGMFVQFEQHVIGNGSTEQQREFKLYEHIHNKAVYDAFNQFLNTFRPFYRQGQPLPWRANSEFISSFIITQENEQAVLENARFSVLTLLQSLCGVMVERVLPTLLPKDLSENQMRYTDQVLQQSLKCVNDDRAIICINQQVLQYIKNDNGDLFETLIMYELAQQIFNDLIIEAEEQFF